MYDQRVWAKKDGLWGVIDLDQNQLVDFIYSSVSGQRTCERHDTGQEAALLILKKGDFFGIVERDTGDVVLPFEYSKAPFPPFDLFKDGTWKSYPWDFKQN